MLNTFILFWSASDVTDPVGDVVRFLQTYNEKYGENHPVFYQGSYSQV